MLNELLTLVATTTLLLGSPGPAPLALAATGATFGFNRGIPFLMGILSGIAVAIVAASLGVTALFSAWPESRTILQIAGALYICYVAYKIASAPVLSNQDDARNLAPSYFDGFILNLLNPKVYAAFFALMSQFAFELNPAWLSTALIGISCFVVATFVDVIWLAIGGALRPYFEHPKQARALRISFAVLMLIAVAVALLKSSS